MTFTLRKSGREVLGSGKKGGGGASKLGSDRINN